MKTTGKSVMKISTDLDSVARIVGFEKAVELCDKACSYLNDYNQEIVWEGVIRPRKVQTHAKNCLNNNKQ